MTPGTRLMRLRRPLLQPTTKVFAACRMTYGSVTEYSAQGAPSPMPGTHSAGKKTRNARTVSSVVSSHYYVCANNINVSLQPTRVKVHSSSLFVNTRTSTTHFQRQNKTTCLRSMPIRGRQRRLVCASQLSRRSSILPKL